jgi:hypothetical protein
MATAEEQSSIVVKKGFKFALLAVAECTAGDSPTPLADFGNGFAVSGDLPAKALETWEDNIGKLHQRELRQTKLFLWSLRKSSDPEVLDNESSELSRDVYRLYLSVLIATPYFSNGRLTAFTGGNAHGVARVRSVSWYNRSWRTIGTPRTALSMHRLREAGELAVALRRHTSNPKHPFVRCLRAFREGCEAGDLDSRFHQFVRCLEGFTIPPFGGSAKVFAGRLARLSTGRRTRALRELYEIRSGIEHLKGPFARMPRKPRGGRHVRLIQRCIQAEAFARFALFTYLSTPALWPHFRTHATIEQFWSQSDSELEKIWQPRIPFSRVLGAFDGDDVKREIRRARHR